jgi:dihydroflavonol-4-reductase
MGCCFFFSIPTRILHADSDRVNTMRLHCELVTQIIFSERNPSMLVMITGGTGFIGYHTTRALLSGGHRVRLLVRSEEKMRRLFGDTISDFVVGDVTDPAAVTRALQGCDAVVHTASMVSIDKKDAELVQQTNVGGTRLVIGGAIEQGLANIIHVSSVTALYDPDASFLNEYSAPGAATNAYGKSKVECEVYVREMQRAGAPIHITYPASVIGPEDPALTEPHQGLITYLMSMVPVPPSGNQWVDVRDIAIAHQRLLESELPPGRYTLGGHFVPWTQLVDVLRKLTGRRIRKVPLPGSLLRGLGRLVDYLNDVRDKPLDIPLTYEGMVYATNWVKMDNSKCRSELALEFRPLEETLRDAIVSLVQAGELEAEKAGDLCG